MIKNTIYINILSVTFFLTACSNTADTPIADSSPNATNSTQIPASDNSTLPAGSVEIVLKDRLDGDLCGYCFDIVGGGQNIKPSEGLQAHTCYSYRGSLGTDQTVDPVLFKSGVIKLIDFDVCASANTLTSDAKLDLESCNGSTAQTFNISADGHIRPSSSTDMCMTAGMETVKGRGGTSAHQIKTLTLQPCSPELEAYQMWRTREGED